MRIRFEATARTFNEAAEYGILLRKTSRQKRAYYISVIIGLLAVTVSVLITASYEVETSTILEIYLLAALLIVMIIDRSCGRVRKALCMFYRGQMRQTESERTQILQLVLEDDDKFHVYRDGIEQSVWDCLILKKALESEEIFDLTGGGKRSTALSIPKSALKSGRIDDFREYLSAKLPGQKSVSYYEIPKKLKDCIVEEKQKAQTRYS